MRKAVVEIHDIDKDTSGWKSENVSTSSLTDAFYGLYLSLAPLGFIKSGMMVDRMRGR